MKTMIFLFLLCATTSLAQIKLVGAGGIGEGKVVPSAGARLNWHGWENEGRVGVVEEKWFLLLTLGREMLGLTTLAEGRVLESSYLLLLGGKGFSST